MATRFWVLSNEDSRAGMFRKQHVEKNGGEWSYSPARGWKWEKTDLVEEKPTKPTKEEIHIEPAKTKRKIFKDLLNKDTNDK